MSTPSSPAVLSGSVEVSILPKGVSTFILSPFCETWALLIARCMTMPHVTMPRTPMRTMMPTMTRMTLRALLPPLEGGGPGAIGEAEVAGTPLTAAPHLLQNFVPSLRGAPQELQNAMVHLMVSLTGEYTAGARGIRGRV